MKTGCKELNLFSLQIDLLAEISQSPRILSEVDAALKAKQMKNDVDEYLKVFYFYAMTLLSHLHPLLPTSFAP